MDEREKIPLSGDQILSAFSPNKRPILISYKELSKFKDLDSLLGKNKQCVLLYQTSENYGHWCCLYQKKNGAVCFFDSYGFIPDDQLNFSQPHLRKSLRQDFRYLTQMLYKSGHPVEYNEYELQNFNNNHTATCGRWCIVRLQYPEISIEKFKDIFLGKGVSPDYIVTKLTDDLFY